MSCRGRALGRAVAASILAATLYPAAAGAASAGAVPMDRLRLATDGSGIVSAEGGAVLPHLAWETAAWIGYANDLFVLFADGRRSGALVGDRVGGGLLASVGLRGRGQLAVEAPFVLHQTRSRADVAGVPAGAGGFGAGSLRLVPKARLLDADRHGVDLAVLAGVTVPLGSPGFVGSELAFQPEIAASRTFGGLRLASDLGATIRSSATLLDTTLGSEITGQLAASYRFSARLPLPVEAGVALSAAVSASRPLARANESSAELQWLASCRPSAAVSAFAAVGVGLGRGWGNPEWRALMGVRMTRAAPAAVPPPSPPTAPVPPASSPPDADGDGVPDARDRCPSGRGPAENRGCPDEDRDADGLVDRLDECPDLAGPADRGGCPREAAVKLTGDRIQFDETMYFDTDEDVIQARSFPLLDAIAKVIAAHPEVKLVRVEGHADAQGEMAHNLKLSERRAQAVVRALVSRGVEAARLLAAGFGPSRPVAGNDTDEGRARNRRVELRVVDPAGDAPQAP